MRRLIQFYSATEFLSIGLPDYSPFYMTYHREARLPIDVELLPTPDESEENMDHFLDSMLDIKSGLKKNAMANITKAQKYQKQYYDQTRTIQVCLLTFSFFSSMQF